MKKKIQFLTGITLGADPEFFFKRGKEVIGAEKIVPEDGIKSTFGSGKVTIDGVQAELNPEANGCRIHLSSEIASCFKGVQRVLKKHKGVTVDFSRMVRVSRKEFNTLSPACRVLGCSPSLNAYDEHIGLGVDPAKYPFRSAGGHIHMGGLDVKWYHKNARRCVIMLDYLLGNTCVLIDRDRANATRRRVYGRAGEFRKQKHGLEYRTLSNFWLEAYPLMSLVTALAKLAITIVHDSNKRHDYESAILNAVDGNDIRKAINENSFSLALRNWKKIEPVLLDMLESGEEFHEEFPISTDNIKEFHHFIKKGMHYWFKEDPIKHWTSGRGKYRGWETFLRQVVRPDMQK